jgi:hypothetical protein
MNTTDSLPVEINISSSALPTTTCLLNFYRTVVEGYKEPAQKSNLVYGTALHKYIDTMYKTKGHIPTARVEALKAFNVPKIDNRKSPHLSDANHMITTAFMTWEMFASKDDSIELLDMLGLPATEVSFSIPYYTDQYIKVNLAGTLDTLAKIKGGCYVIRDWKTTSSWDSKSYFKSYEMSKQLRFYVLALKIMSEMYPDSMLGQIGKTRVGARIDAIFVKPAPNETKWASSEVFQYRDTDIAAFRMTLDDKIQEISRAIKTGYLPKNGLLTGSCETKWGLCKFWNVCQVDDKVAEVLLARDFVKKQFNPLNYNE